MPEGRPSEAQKCARLDLAVCSSSAANKMIERLRGWRDILRAAEGRNVARTPLCLKEGGLEIAPRDIRLGVGVGLPVLQDA